MNANQINAVTGAFSYTGKYITRRLLAKGAQVITLTGHPGRPNEFGGKVAAFPFDFEHPDRLVETLRGVDVLYNTYWVRFDHADVTYQHAVENTIRLVTAAQEAGVRRIVHVSISNPSLDSPLPYFRGKAILEQAVRQSGLSYAIVRPTVIFGQEDILINNIAYLLRRFPLFAIPGSGDYRLQPIYVEDMADLCVQAGESDENMTLDACGPQVFSFDELVSLIAEKIDRRPLIVHLPASLAFFLSRLIGLFVRDVVLTRQELEGLTAGLLVSSSPPTGETPLAEWLGRNAATVGAAYASELGRHYRD